METVAGSKINSPTHQLLKRRIMILDLLGLQLLFLLLLFELFDVPCNHSVDVGLNLDIIREKKVNSGGFSRKFLKETGRILTIETV